MASSLADYFKKRGRGGEAESDTTSTRMESVEPTSPARTSTGRAGSGSALADYFTKQRDEKLGIKKYSAQDDAYQSWAGDVFSFSEQLTRDYKGREGKYQPKDTFQTYRDTTYTALSDLLKKGYDMREFYTQKGPEYDSVYGADISKGILSDIQQNIDYLLKARSALGQEGMMWDQFNSEDEWNTAKRYAGYASIPQAKDFEEKSKYQSTYKPGTENFNPLIGKYIESGYGDLAYDVLNRDPDAISRGSVADYKRYNDLDDDTLKVFNYLYSTQGPEAAYQYLDDMAVGEKFSGVEAMALNAYQAMGLPSLSATLGKGLSVLTGDEEAAKRNEEWYGDLMRDLAQTQEQHPHASTVGSVGGTLGLMGAIASGVGAIPGFTSMPAIAQSLVSGAASMGGTTALQNAGNVATGMESLGDYGLDVLTSTGAGVASGLAAGGAGVLGKTVLQKLGLTQNMLARTVTAGFAGASGAAARSGVRQGSDVLRGRDDFDNEELLKEALVGFAFSSIGFLTRNFTASPRSAAAQDEGEALADKYFKGMTQEEAKAEYRRLSRLYHPDLHMNDTEEARAAAEAIMKEINTAWGWINKTSGAQFYQDMKTAKQNGDTAGYQSAKSGFDSSVAEIAELAAGGAFPGQEAQEAVAILEAVSQGGAIAQAEGGATPSITPTDLPEEIDPDTKAALQVAAEEMARAEEAGGVDNALVNAEALTEEAQRGGDEIPVSIDPEGMNIIDTPNMGLASPTDRPQEAGASVYPSQEESDAMEAQEPGEEVRQSGIGTVDGTPPGMRSVTIDLSPRGETQQPTVPERFPSGREDVDSFSKSLPPALATTVREMYNEEQEPGSYLEDMMKAYRAGSEGITDPEEVFGPELENAHITLPQFQAAMLAGQNGRPPLDVRPAEKPTTVASNPDLRGDSADIGSSFKSLARKLADSNRAEQDGMLYTITRIADGYIGRVQATDQVGAYIKDARSIDYQTKPMETRDEAVSELLAVAKSSFYRDGTPAVSTGGVQQDTKGMLRSAFEEGGIINQEALKDPKTLDIVSKIFGGEGVKPVDKSTGEDPTQTKKPKNAEKTKEAASDESTERPGELGEKAEEGAGGAGTGLERSKRHGTRGTGSDGRGGAGLAQRGRGDQLDEVPEDDRTGRDLIPAPDFSIPADGLKLPSGEKSRAKANIEAIKLVKKLIAEDRPATTEEQAILSKFVGWGGLVNALDESKAEWASIYKQLRGLMTEEEFKAALASTKNAHYTSVEVIRSIYEGLRGLGFRGGRLLEPSAGIGHFLRAMPEDLAKLITGKTMVELDKLTGSIAKYLYPGADTRIMGFEEAKLPDDYYDIVISNVPFGNYGVADKSYPKSVTKAIHNYFFAKSLDKVRPGGLVCFITSRYTMDAQDSKVRAYIAQRADLLGAIRLPDTAFKSNAGTEVVTDILVLKKREAGAPYAGEDFLESDTLQYYGDGPSVLRWNATNEYFRAHPEMVLGTPEASGGMYRSDGLTYKALPGNLGKQIQKAFGKIRGEMDYPAAQEEKPTAAVEKQADTGHKQGSVKIKGGKAVKNVDGKEVDLGLKEWQVERMGSILPIKDKARELLRLQLAGADEKEIAKARKELNKLYDEFTAKYKGLHYSSNLPIVRKDIDSAFILSLEDWDKETGTATKSAIFRENTVAPSRISTNVETVEDGVAVSMNTFGRINVSHIANLMGKKPEDVEKDILERGLAFKDRDGEIVPAQVYLSGNVRKKLRDAEALAASDPSYKRNVKALKEVIPKDIPPSEIKVTPGATWVPDDVYERFVAHLLGVTLRGEYDPDTWRPPVTIKYQKEIGRYLITTNGIGYNRYGAANTSEWGTQDIHLVDGRTSLLDIMLNNGTPKVTRDAGDGKTRIVDRKATALAQAKLEELRKEFNRWLWDDEGRRATLAPVYNELFNAIVTPKYDGSNFTVDGYNTAKPMRPHQANVVYRAVVDHRPILLAHMVGAGKTYEMASIAMKARQLGTLKKPLFVVPKNLVAQWAGEFYEFYPAANILVAEDDSFTKNKRREFVGRIATGSYDAIIMSTEQFEHIPMSKAYRGQFIQDEIDRLEQAIRETKAAKGDRVNIKQLEKSKASREAELKKLQSEKDEDNLDFEELGIDGLFVDEAHRYKNLNYFTKTTGVTDLGNTQGAQRSIDMYMKTRYLRKLNGGRGIVFATATPIMNSVAEAYHMMRYLYEPEMEAMGINTFDAWANQFADVVNVRREKPGRPGQYEIKASLSKYKNMPEFQQMFRSFADVIVDASELPYLKIPKMEGGSRIVVKCQPSEFQKAYIKKLAERTDKLKRGFKHEKGEDNILVINGDGEKCTVSARLVDPAQVENPDGKIMTAARNIAQIWKDTAGEKGTQIVFLDKGTPGGAADKSGVNLYRDLRDYLVAEGVKESEIAFIHDYESQDDKDRLFDAVNAGEIRILIGSTAKMGIGMNVQKRVTALHELNPPPRPGDLLQNEGRALRQGNLHDEVAVYTYITEGLFDSMSWDRITRKSRFINQVMKGDNVGREMEADDDLTLSAAQISAIATGNPLIIEQFEVGDKVTKLTDLQQGHQAEVYAARDKAAKSKATLAQAQATLPKVEKDIKTRKDVSGDKFSITINGKTYDKRADAGEVLVKIAKEAISTGEITYHDIGSFAGFTLAVTSQKELLLKGENSYSSPVNLDSPSGTVQALENSLKRLEPMRDNLKSVIAQCEKDIPKFEEIAARPFEQQKELDEALKRQAEIEAILNPEESREEMVADANDGGEVMMMRELAVDGLASDAGQPGTATSGRRHHPEEWTTTRAGSEDKKPMSLPELFEKMRHDFGFNLTKGHVRGAGVRGQFNQRDKGIRTRLSQDLPTACHELGHALDDRYGLTSHLTEEQHKELLEALGDLGAAYKDREKISEGLAEYMRKFLTNAQEAESSYPAFTDHMKKALSPADLARLENFADEVNAYLSLGADTATSSVHLREEGLPDARGLGEKAQDAIQAFRQQWIDSNQGIKRFDEETGADTYTLATNAAYADAIAGRLVTGDLTDLNGQYVAPGLRSALEGLDMKDKATYKLFGEYLIVKHGPERLAEGLQVFAREDHDNPEWMAQRQAAIEAEHPEFKEISERLYQFQQNFLQIWGVDTGLISDDTAQAWAKRWKYYVPFNRFVSEDRRGRGAKRGFANQDNPIRRAHGSGLDFIHPVDNIITNIVRMVNAGVRNNVMREITSAAMTDEGSDATFLEKIPTPMQKRNFSIADVKADLLDFIEGTDTTDAKSKEAISEHVQSLDDILTQYGRGKAGGNVVTVMRGGSPEFWKVNDPLLLESITNMTPARLPAILEAWRKLTRLQSAFITGTNLIWSVTSNAPRDLQTMLMYSDEKNPLKLLKNVGLGYVNRIKDTMGAAVDPYYAEFLAMGGGQESFYTADRDLAKVARRKLGRVRSRNPFDAIAFISDTIETGPRFAAYRLARQKGLSPNEAIYISHDITVNFRRRGTKAQGVMAISPFINASIQGVDKHFRHFTAADKHGQGKERAKTAAGRWGFYLAMAAGAAALTMAVNLGDDEHEKYYNQLSSYTKNNYYVIPITDEDGSFSGRYIAIPKGRDTSTLISFLQRLMEYSKGNEDAFSEFYEYWADNNLPNIVGDLAQGNPYGAVGSLSVAGTFVDLVANRDFLGRPIVSNALQDLPKEQQYTGSTSLLAYELGQALHTSPQQIDYVLTQTFGYVGKYSKAVAPVDSSRRDLTLGLRNQFVKDAQYSTDIVNRLYDRAEETATEKNGDPENMDKAITAAMDDRMKRFYSRYNGLSRNAVETSQTRGTRQAVLDMVDDYLAAAEGGFAVRSYQAVFDVVRKDGSTELLPSVMQSYVKDGNGEKHELSAVEYVEFQTDYNRLYWEYVEGNLEEAGTDAERRAVLRAAKELAAEQAKRRALSRLGLEPEDYEHKGKNGKESVTVPYKYEGISEDEIITFEAQKALASSDGSFSQDEAIDIIQEMVDSGLSKEAAYTLFHAANSSWTDKNNPWKRYKP